MKVRAASPLTGRRLTAGPLAPQTPPSWVQQIVTERGEHLQLTTAAITNATKLSADALADAVAAQYRMIAHGLRPDGWHPLRIWNFIPDIQATLVPGDRYMAFNVGRFAAYEEWFGGQQRFCTAVPTASGVGVNGDTLWIHILSAKRPGMAFENPRQIPAYQYSRRYGIRPPCFARATQFESMLLIGGTASIIGQDSRHADDPATQTQETLHNLQALIGSACSNPTEALQRLTDLRVHVADADDVDIVAELLEEQVPPHVDVEFVQAALCRRELLVEIEGRADVSS